MTTLIPRNTTIPYKKTETFSTADDNQTAVDIHVLQGERPMAADNMTLGKFRLEGIPPAPRGLPQVEVTFDIDANGILNVRAKDKATGKEQEIKITASTNLSKGDVERMVQDAQRHSSEDNRRREAIQARNEADTTIYQAEKSLRDLGDKVAQADREKVEAKIRELKSAMNGDNVQQIRSLISDLQQVTMAIGQRMYQGDSGGTTGPQGDGGHGDHGQPGGEDVVEGEYRQV
jgi:molecular chaperone DnaK